MPTRPNAHQLGQIGFTRFFTDTETQAALRLSSQVSNISCFLPNESQRLHTSEILGAAFGLHALEDDVPELLVVAGAINTSAVGKATIVQGTFFLHDQLVN